MWQRSILLNEHGQKEIIILTKCRVYPSGSKRRKKAKEAKMREEKVEAKSRNIQDTILQWQ